MMQPDLLGLLVALPGVPPAAQINWGSHPQGRPLPALVLNVISDVEGIHMSGPDGLSAARVQIDCYGAEYGAAALLSNIVRGGLNGFRGGRFQGVFLDGQRDFHESGAPDRPYRISLDFNINYER